MHRLELQALAELRIAEANALLVAGFPTGAYYLAGYSVELAIKAIIAKRFEEHTIPEKNLVREYYTGHSVENLLKLAKLQGAFQERQKNPDFSRNWSIVKNWSTDARYKIDQETFIAHNPAQKLQSLFRGDTQAIAHDPAQKLQSLSLLLGLTQSHAQVLLEAITSEENGILSWLKTFW